jgi:hypothetical protein
MAPDRGSPERNQSNRLESLVTPRSRIKFENSNDPRN